MKLYFKYGAIYVALVLGINLAFNFSWGTVGNFFLVAAIVCFPAIVVALLVHLIPKTFYNPKNKIFAARKGEDKLFEKLNVKKWKDKIPEAGKTGGFARNHLYDPRNPDYIKKYIIEGCLAEALHSLSIIWGIAALFLVPKQLVLPMGVPLALFNFFVHIFPILIQRYMRPRLMKTLERLTKAQQEKQAAEQAAEPLAQQQPQQVAQKPAANTADSAAQSDPAQTK